jgi:hypothetical protein
MPRGRPDPLSQVPDGGRFHLVPGLQILQQDRAQLDESQRALASGDDGVHAGTVGIVRADPAIAITVECRGVAARAAVALAGDQIDERCFLGLLHGLPFCVAGRGANGTGRFALMGPGGRSATGFGTVYGAKPLPPRGKSSDGTRIQPVAGPPGSGAATEDEVLRQRAEFVERRVDLAQ